MYEWEYLKAEGRFSSNKAYFVFICSQTIYSLGAGHKAKV